MRWMSIVFGVTILAVTTVAYARQGPGGRNYNPATETTVTGTVQEVQNIPSSGKGGGGIHLVFSTEGGPVEVHVGPARFADSKGFTFAKGDTLTITGSKVTMDGARVLIARAIKKGDQVLTLRNASGIPLWSGRGRGRW